MQMPKSTGKPLPAGYGAPILYLDFDGPLHYDNALRHPRRGVYLMAPPGYVLFQHVGLLEDALKPYPEVLIVLSTSWVKALSFSRAKKRLTSNLQSRVIGATYHTQMNRFNFEDMTRAEQILDDVQRRRPRDWLALDNDGWQWPAVHRDHLVLTDDCDGLSVPAVLHEFRQKLAAMCAVHT